MSLQPRTVSCRRALVAGAFAIGLLVGMPAYAAVSTSGTSYASQTTPPVQFQSKIHSASGATSAASNSRSDATGSSASSKAHATSNASSVVTGGGVVKSATGLGWLDSGSPTKDARATSWTAYAYGTPIFINGPTPTVPLQLVIPSQADPALPDDGFDPAVQHLPTDPQLMFRPRQELYNDKAGFAPGSESPFDLNLSIRAAVEDGMGGAVQLFAGDARLNAEFPAVNSLQTAGGLTPGMFQLIDHPGDPFRNHFAVQTKAVLATFTVATGVPINADLGVYLTMGGPHEPLPPGVELIAPGMDFPPLVEFPPVIFDPLAMGIPRPSFGGGGSLTVMLVPPAGYTISSLVPEPSTIALSLFGAIALATIAWRRNRKAA